MSLQTLYPSSPSKAFHISTELNIKLYKMREKHHIAELAVEAVVLTFAFSRHH